MDYLEFHDPSGWVLHIDGDGGGRLIRRQLPGRRVIYLPATFRWQQSARRISRCHETISITSPSCSRAVYFVQANNETRVCQCPEGFWVKQYFEKAFEEMRRSPGERRDRRMLKRAWLREPPMAVLKGK
ncbi:hypothetical protein CEQ90_18105 [Lewinellaceae bacterium SD302]|nr:hypothetical protein CEQ90_18105 [Lewinellaceae bacterium SD302]